MNKLPDFLFKTVHSFQIGQLTFAPNVLTAGAIILLLFFLVLTMAQVRRHFMDWSAKGAFFGIFLGFLLALIIEGFFIVGGRTVLTTTLGWKNAPKPIQIALDQGKDKLREVLGVNSTIPNSSAMSSEELINFFKGMDAKTLSQLKSAICTP